MTQSTVHPANFANYTNITPTLDLYTLKTGLMTKNGMNSFVDTAHTYPLAVHTTDRYPKYHQNFANK